MLQKTVRGPRGSQVYRRHREGPPQARQSGSLVHSCLIKHWNRRAWGKEGLHTYSEVKVHGKPCLKGTVARDFWPLIFFMNRPHMGP